MQTGNPTFLFLLEAIGVHTGEPFDQRRLAMVHVTGCSHHNVLHEPEANRLTRFSQQQRWRVYRRIDTIY